MDNTSIQDLSPRVNYLGDSIKTEFNIPFQIINHDYIEVFINKIKVTTGYNILTNNIVFSTPPTSGESITIMRVIPLEHIESLRTKGILDFDLLDNVITNLVAQVQNVNDKLNRTPMAPVNYTGTASDLFSIFEEATDEALSVLDSVTDIKNQVEVLQSNISEDLGNAVSEATQKSEEAADLAKLWASQDEGLVEDLDYSSKKHASRSKEFALEAEDWAKASKNILGDVSQGLRNDLPYGKLIMNGQSASTINGMLLQHNETNFPDVVKFLESGDLKSIDINIFNSRVETNGWCGVFGYDSVNKSFKTPKITNMDQVGVIPHSNGSNRNLGRSLIYQENKETNGIADVDVYSDGWCEQRGLFTTPWNSYQSGTINLIKGYKSTTQYLINLTSANSGDAMVPCVVAKNPNNFNYIRLTNVYGLANWNTFGYIEPISDPRNTIFYIQCYNTDIEPEILNYTGALDDYMEDTIIPQINSEVNQIISDTELYWISNSHNLGEIFTDGFVSLLDGQGWCQGDILPTDGEAGKLLKGLTDEFEKYSADNTKGIAHIDFATYETILSNNDGNCVFFGYDSVNHLVRLPKIRDFSTASTKQIVGWNIPNYSISENFTSGVDFIAPNKGIIVFCGTLADGWNRALSINSQSIFNTSNSGSYLSGYQQGSIWLVDKGDIILATNAAGLKFYSFKGNNITPIYGGHKKYKIQLANIGVKAAESQWAAFYNGLTNKADKNGGNLNSNEAKAFNRKLGLNPQYVSPEFYYNTLGAVISYDTGITGLTDIERMSLRTAVVAICKTANNGYAVGDVICDPIIGTTSAYVTKADAVLMTSGNIWTQIVQALSIFLRVKGSNTYVGASSTSASNLWAFRMIVY